MIVLIRAEPHSLVEAVNRQLTHHGYRISQIVFLVMPPRSDKPSPCPGGGTRRFNEKMFGGGGSSTCLLEPSGGAVLR